MRVSSVLLVLCLCCGLGMGCGDGGSSGNGGGGDAAAGDVGSAGSQDGGGSAALDAAATSDATPAADGAAAGDATQGGDAGGGECNPEETPWCVDTCGSDYGLQPECVGGAWKCPEGSVDSATCPPGTCWGPPTIGEVCSDGQGWVCDPVATGVTANCPAQREMVCPHCNGFDQPVDRDGCHCACEDAMVWCAPAE